jgi:hypothetical protein
MVLFGVVGALSAVSGCTSGDPTDNEGTPTAIVSDPNVVFVNQGESQPVVVSVVDEDGQPLEAEFTLGTVGAGITVAPDPDFLPVTGGNPLRRQARFFVQAVDLAASFFEVSALGITDTIEVTSVPPNLAATLSNLAPALGDTITITAPAGTFFSQTSAVSFGVQDLVITDRAADGSVITFIPAPTINGPLTVTEVKVTSNPDLTFTLATTETLVTDSLVNVAATFSSQTPALGETVTLTLPAGVKVLPTATGLTIAAAALPPRDPVIAADSGRIAFVPAPNSDSVVVIPGVIAARLPMYPQTLPTTTKVTTPVVAALPSTLSSTAPAVNTPVILTSTDGSFTFVDPAVVGVGTDSSAFVTGQTASTITFLPAPGSTGVVGVGAVDVVGFALPLPSTAAALTTSATVPSLAGTGTPGTAPPLVVPAIGGASALYDSGTFDYQAPILGGAFGTFPSRLYRLVVPTGRDITVTLNWNSAEDLGVYWFATDGTTEPPELGPADAGGGGAFPESATNTFAAGTYLLAVVSFGPATPPWLGILLQSAATP